MTNSLLKTPAERSCIGAERITRRAGIRRSGDTSPLETALGLLLLAAGIGMVIATLASTTPAHAQSACGVRSAILDKLSSSYGETRQSRGLSGNTAIVEIFASKTTGTWSIVQTTPDGKTCIVAAGDNFQNFAPPIKGDPA